MPKFVIHIGPAKTGSKYLQSSLFGLRGQMLKDGINYADDWWSSQRPGFSHAPVLERLQGPPDLETENAFRKLRSSDFHTVILSCEGFTALSQEKLEYWRSLLGKSPVEIVFYCRRWSERLPSSWRQDIKEGRFETFPELCLRTFRKPVVNPGINYALIWESYMAVFGKDSLRLVSYSNLRDFKVDIVRHFLGEVVKWRYDVVLPTENIVTNVSPDAIETEILRCLNYLHFCKTGKTDLRVRESYFKQRSGAADGTQASSATAKGFGDRDEAHWQRLTEAMQQNLGKVRIDDSAAFFDKAYEAMSRYRHNLISKEYGEEIFRHRVIDVDCVRPDYLLRPGVTESLQALYAALDLP